MTTLYQCTGSECVDGKWACARKQHAGFRLNVAPDSQLALCRFFSGRERVQE